MQVASESVHSRTGASGSQAADGCVGAGWTDLAGENENLFLPSHGGVCRFAQNRRSP
jgi:hypothetical protein